MRSKTQIFKLLILSSLMLLVACVKSTPVESETIVEATVTRPIDVVPPTQFPTLDSEEQLKYLYDLVKRLREGKLNASQAEQVEQMIRDIVEEMRPLPEDSTPIDDNDIVIAKESLEMLLRALGFEQEEIDDLLNDSDGPIVVPKALIPTQVVEVIESEPDEQELEGDTCIIWNEKYPDVGVRESPRDGARWIQGIYQGQRATVLARDGGIYNQTLWWKVEISDSSGNLVYGWVSSVAVEETTQESCMSMPVE